MSITTPRFNFFDKEVLKDPERDGRVFESLKELHITCSTSGRGQLIFGSADGTVCLLDKQLKLSAFTAHTNSISLIHQLRQSSYLFTIGQDVEVDQPSCKIWNMDRIDSHGVPHCARIIKLAYSQSKDSSSSTKLSQITTLAVHENMHLMAVGFKQGTVCLYKGDLTKDRQCKQTYIHDGGQDITGLGFRVVDKSQLLFVAQPDLLVAYNITNNEKPTQTLHENYGCQHRCSAMGDEMINHQFLLGRADGVYYMMHEGRGGTAPLEGDKSMVHWYRGYLITVSKSSINKEMDIVTIFDTANKFLAYTGPIPHVSNILFEWNSICVLGGDNKLYFLLEKSTQSKLDILFKKNQYSIAISIAKSQHYDKHGLVDIFKQYGDYLYKERGDHDAAVEQYKKTIGHIEPSYVIRKFLDAQRLHNLTSYLEELHHKHQATEDHTTLLLNCYTKLKDTDKLDEFIWKKDKDNTVNFDVETAIKVLRQSDYHRHALQLAEHHNKHEWYMKIQLENVQDYKAALAYMQQLSFYEAEDYMKKYGKVLIHHIPDETTVFLKKLCLGEFGDDSRAKPDEFIHIFVNKSNQLREFLEAMVTSDVKPGSVVYNTLLELYIQAWADNSLPKDVYERKAMNLLSRTEEYAQDQALVLCQMYKFRSGMLYLYEQGKMYQQVLRHYMDEEEYSKVIETCTQWGHVDSNLWIMALSYFAKKEDDCKSQMEEVLRNIDEQQLLPPLLVIRILSHSRVCTLGVVKKFLTKRLAEENKQIEEDERLIKEYSEETKTLRQKIEDIKTKPVVFQGSRCCVCKYPLELSSVHFLCQHSYHSHCFESYAENENDCPACMEENRRVLESVRQLERSKDVDLSNSFHNQLQQCKDGFDVIAEYFGKGVINKVSLLSEPMPQAATEELLRMPSTAKPMTPRRNPFSSEEPLAQAKPPSNTSMTSSSPQQMPVRLPAAGSQSLPRISLQTSQPSIMHSGSQQFSQSDQAQPVHATRAPVSTSQTLPRVNLQSTANTSTNRSSEIPQLVVGSPRNAVLQDDRASPRDSMLPPSASRPIQQAQRSNQTMLSTSAPRQGMTTSSSHSSLSAQSALTLDHHRSNSSGKLPSGHKRQSSAGRMIESGFSYLKGQVKQASDQAKNKLKLSNPFEHADDDTSNPFITEDDHQNAVSKPANPFTGQKTESNPFESESTSGNPFEDEPGNPFSEPDTRDSNPFEAPSNPYVDSSQSSNPFE